MSDVVDGMWSVIVRYAGKEGMFILAPIRTYQGGLEELPVEFCDAQGGTAKDHQDRKQEAKRMADELNEPEPEVPTLTEPFVYDDLEGPLSKPDTERRRSHGVVDLGSIGQPGWILPPES